MPHPTAVLHERYLRHLWERQELMHHPLSSMDGQAVHVLHPGTLNIHAGPDFRNARIRIGDTTYAGDVEFHRHTNEWIEHGHHRDPHYNSVILHVVLEEHPRPKDVQTECGRAIPTVCLAQFLLPHPDELTLFARLDERAREARAIPCADLNYDLDPSTVERWIFQLAERRLEDKVTRMAERFDELQHRTPEQLLYEGLLDALGYSRNRIPFQRLARAVTLETLERLGVIDTPLLVEAVLFGVAGLLPEKESAVDQESRIYAERLRAAWQAMEQRYRGERLIKTDWSCSPSRPRNRPSVRLAQAAAIVHAIMRGDLTLNILLALSAHADQEERFRRLRSLLQREPSGFWRTHEDFDLPTQRSTIGADRILAMITNIVVPFGLVIGRDPQYRVLHSKTLELLQMLPASGGNRIIEMMERHLLRGRSHLRSAQHEQGIIHLYHFYCMRERCGDCTLGQAMGLR